MSKQGSEMRHRPESDTGEPDGPEETRIRGDAGDTGEARDTGGGSGRKRIDLSVAQVSGSALAAVIAAKLASTLGVYGTILGAGVISVIATCGGPVFQHLFKRTGEQMRDVTVAAKPKARQVPVPAPPSPYGTAPDVDDRTLMLRAVAVGPPAPADEEFGAATTHGTPGRRWKRPAIAAALVFGVTMGGITTYELVSGEDFGGTKGRTTFGSVVRPGSAGQEAPTGNGAPTPAPSGSAEDGGARPDGTGTPRTDTTPSPGGREAGDGGAEPTREPTPTAPTPTAPTPTAPTTGPTAEPTAPATPTTEPTAPAGPTTAPPGGPAEQDAGPSAPATPGAG